MTYLILCRGRSFETSRLLAASSDNKLIKEVSRLLAGSRHHNLTISPKNNIRELRKSKGLRQADIEAMTAGCLKRSRLSSIERGSRIDSAEAKTLSEVFGLPVAELGLTLTGEAAAR